MNVELAETAARIPRNSGPPNEPPNNYTQPTVTDGGVTWVLVVYNDE